MSNTKTTRQIDARGPRFVAWITTAVLVIALVASGVSTLTAAVILSLQAVIFVIGAVAGPHSHPYGLAFAHVVAPRLAPVSTREPVPPLKFAQLVGFVFTASSAAGFAADVPQFGVLTTAAALAAAFLNAAFGICLGCRLYPLVVRLRPAPRTSELA